MHWLKWHEHSTKNPNSDLQTRECVYMHVFAWIPSDFLPKRSRAKKTCLFTVSYLNINYWWPSSKLVRIFFSSNFYANLSSFFYSSEQISFVYFSSFELFNLFFLLFILSMEVACHFLVRKLAYLFFKTEFCVAFVTDFKNLSYLPLNV